MNLPDFELLPRTRLVSPHLVVVSETPSTNSYLLERGDSLEAFSTVVTLNQTAGRGRLGRPWLSKAGEAVSFSFSVPISQRSGNPPEFSGLIPLMVGTSVVEALSSHGVHRVSLKWPNDVHVDGRKIAGILCERAVTDFVIAGVGLNLLAPRDVGRTDVAGLSEFLTVDADVVDQIVCDTISGLQRLVQMGRNTVIGRVSAVMSTLGREVTVEEPRQISWSGVAYGLNPEGFLLVREKHSHTLRVVVAADIEHLYQ